jgi:hypothetical protein
MISKEDPLVSTLIGPYPQIDAIFELKTSSVEIGK